MNHKTDFAILKVSLYILILFIISNCSNPNEDSNEEQKLEDGTYCSEIKVYNPSTGNKSIYSLNVEIESGQLVQIYWPNGGVLDDSHFEPADVIDNMVDFTSDRGYQYEIELNIDAAQCEQCYEKEKEKQLQYSLDSLDAAAELENERHSLMLEEMELEKARIENSGYRVIYTGCKDLFIIEYEMKYVLAKRIANTKSFEVSDRLDCDITGLGITAVGNLTQHFAGNIEIIAIEKTRFLSISKLDEYCKNYLKF